MMTTSEAKQKHCPLINATCKGQECMAWRWATVEQLAHGIAERVRLDDGRGIDPAEFIAEWPNTDRPPEGYCGLAGMPLCAA